jgi:hypothetical protein
MAEVTYYVALPFVASDDNMAAGEPSYRQILVTARPVRRRRLWADGQSVWR